MDVSSETLNIKLLLDNIEYYIELLDNSDKETKEIENSFDQVDEIRTTKQDVLAKLITSKCATQYMNILQNIVPLSGELKEQVFNGDVDKCAAKVIILCDISRSLNNSKSFDLKLHLSEILICFHNTFKDKLKRLNKQRRSIEENTANEDANNDIKTLNRSRRWLQLLGISIGDSIRSIYSDAKVEKHFQEVFGQIARNYDAINKNYDAIKTVEAKVDRNFVALQLVSDLVNQTLATVEQTRVEMHQRFNEVLDSIKDLRIRPIILKLNDFVQYFESERGRIKKLPHNDYINKLSEQNGILLYLKDCRTPKGNSLRTLLNEIIEEGYVIPQNADDKTAFDALYALYYGTKTYVSVMFFLLEQYTYLADFHYENEDVEEYNKYFHLIQESFQEFKHSLIGEDLIERVINMLSTVQSRNFIGSESEGLPDRIESLKEIKKQLKEMKLPMMEDMPETLLGKPKFENTGIITPIGEWKNETKVSYALQYKSNNIYSKVGAWSIPFTVAGKANPFLTIPVDPHRRTRLIFRKFNNNKPQLVGIINDKYQTKFRDIDRDLYNAASRLNDENIALQEMDTLIHNGANANVVFYRGRRAIHAAAQGGNSQVALQFLIRNNTNNIDVKDKNGYTPIYIAAEAGHDDFVELLIKHGADINASINSGSLTPLHIAAYKGFVSTVKTLMQSNTIDVNAKDEENFTPFHSAVFGGAPVVNALISNNSTDINARSKEGLTPLHLASVNNHHDVVEALLKSNRVHINVGAEGSITALHFASMLGHIEIVKTFIAQSETDLNAASIHNWTALHYAVVCKKRDVVSELLKIKDTNVNVGAEGNITPLHIAAATGQEAVALDLLEKKAVVDEQTKSKQTALHLAVMNGNQEMISILINHGANIQAKTIHGSTPLHLATANSKLDIVKNLIEKNSADLSVKDYSGKTLLHLAAGNGELDIIKYLIEKNSAGLRVKDNSSKTPVQLAALNAHLNVVKYLIDEKNVSSDGIIFIAAENGSLDIIEYLLGKGGVLNVKNAKGETPFYIAIRCGQLNIVKYFGEKRTDIGDTPDTPLHYAARYRQLDVVKYLVGKEAPLNANNAHGETPLHTTISYPELDIKKYLIENETGTQVEGKTLSANYLQLDIVKYLLNKGANLNKRDSSGMTPLHAAAMYRHLDIVKCLVENGADVTIRNINGESPLHTAAKYGQLNIVKYLMDKKNIDANNTKDNWGGNPLHKAVSSGNLSLVRYLVDEKNVGANVKDNHGRIPLHFAIHGLHGIKLDGHSLGIVKYLVEEKKSDVNCKDNLGKTPLHKAALYGSFNVVKYFVEKSADVNIRSNNGNTALYLAARAGHLAIVKYLVEEKGLDVNVVNTLHETSLHTAAEFGNLNIIKYLVEKGADVNSITKNGENSLHTAASGYNTLDTLKYLVDKGVDVNAKNKNGKTPLNLATESAYGASPAMVDFLRNSQQRVRHRRHKQPDLQEENSYSSVYTSRYHSIATESLQNDKVGFNIIKATNGARQLPSFINVFANSIVSAVKGISNLVSSSFKTDLSTEHSQPPKVLTMQHTDLNSTLFLLDVFVRKITGKKYVSTADQYTPVLEARCYALNITREFEKVFKDTAKKLGISTKELSFDPVKILGGVEGKIISGELSKIPKILYLAAREACPNNEMFLRILYGNIESMLNEQFSNKSYSNNQTQSTAISSNNKMSASSSDNIFIEGNTGNFSFNNCGDTKKIITTLESCELINLY